MKEVVLTRDSFQLAGPVIPLIKAPVVSLGVDEQWIDAHFIDPKRWVYVKEKASAQGYDEVGSDMIFYYFFHKDKGICHESTYKVACSKLLKQMPALPNYTKFLGLDFEEADLNEKLKLNIDGLGLDQLETLILETGFVGRSRREARFGPSGVIIAMSDDYDISIRY